MKNAYIFHIFISFLRAYDAFAVRIAENRTEVYTYTVIVKG